MTRLHADIGDDNPYPRRMGLRNFTWTDEAISDWEDIWHELWHLGYKWEWQNSDRYARRYGDTFNLHGLRTMHSIVVLNHLLYPIYSHDYQVSMLQ